MSIPGVITTLGKLLLLAVVLCLPQTRVWGLQAPADTAPPQIASVTPSFIGENPSACPDDVSGSTVAPKTLPSTIGHATPWDQMSVAQRKAFQHSYSRHGSELGLPPWKQSNAAELQNQFNNVVGYIRQNGTQLPGPIYKPWNGQSVKVNFFEGDFNGTKYYYYEDAATGTFISAGKARP